MNELNSQIEFQPQTYRISELFIKRSKVNYLLSMIMPPIGICLMTFLVQHTTDTPFNFQFFICFIGCVSIFLELEIFIVSRIMLKKVKENTLTIGEDFIQRKSKVLEPPIQFKFIQKLAIKYAPNGNVNTIDIQTSSQSVRLCGFENMSEIAELLKSKSPSAKVKEHTYKLDYNHPLAFITIFVACILVFYFARYKFFLPLNDIFLVGFGIWLLLGKPISKAQGDRFRAIEVICSILMIGCMALSYLP
nr:hypothetical protein [uncultured Cellulosilyticum sp.]